MNAENTKYLFDTYPILYRDHTAPITQSLMAFGFEHGDGWFDLIDKLSAKLEMLNNEPACPYYTIAEQVKEKFGTLRFYTHQQWKSADEPTEAERARGRVWSDIIWDITCRAESKSAWICEECGDHGETYTDGWHQTLCTYHRAHQENRRFDRDKEYKP